MQPDFETAHFLNGFGHSGWQVPLPAELAASLQAVAPVARFGPVETVPELPDHWDVIEEANDGLSVPAGHQPGAHLPQFDVQ